MYRLYIIKIFLFVNICFWHNAAFCQNISDSYISLNLENSLGRGINLGNQLDESRQKIWSIYPKDDYFKIIKSVGFDFVRIPIRWGLNFDRKTKKIDAFFLSRVDHVINMALKQNLKVIINIHHYQRDIVDGWGDKDRLVFLALWRQLSKHYAKYPNNVFFELLNEPARQLSPEHWNYWITQAIDIIRKHNKSRKIIVSPAGMGNIESLQYLKLDKNKKNLILTVHYYYPFEFTHQGAYWVNSSDQWLGMTWPTSKNNIDNIITMFLLTKKFAKKLGFNEVLLGEFGTYYKTDKISRANWTKSVRQSAEEFGFSWAYWDFDTDFGIFERNTEVWDCELLKALIPKTRCDFGS